jgi:hypothetical protein
MTDLANEDLCTICHRDKEAHKSMRHTFSPFGQSSTLFEKTPEAPSPPPDQPRSTVRLPSASDPILRMVLLRKGLITVADIEAVEQELRATGVAGHDPAQTLG